VVPLSHAARENADVVMSKRFNWMSSLLIEPAPVPRTSAMISETDDIRSSVSFDASASSPASITNTFSVFRAILLTSFLGAATWFCLWRIAVGYWSGH